MSYFNAINVNIHLIKNNNPIIRNDNFQKKYYKPTSYSFIGIR